MALDSEGLKKVFIDTVVIRLIMKFFFNCYNTYRFLCYSNSLDSEGFF